MPVLLLAAASKLPFYVVGGALAVWAVVLAVMGLRNPDFPDARGARGVMAFTLVLVAATVAVAIVTA